MEPPEPLGSAGRARRWRLLLPQAGVGRSGKSYRLQGPEGDPSELACSEQGVCPLGLASPPAQRCFVGRCTAGIASDRCTAGRGSGPASRIGRP
eukprot:13566904-Alexandrium_andersonii.AAC.1